MGTGDILALGFEVEAEIYLYLLLLCYGSLDILSGSIKMYVLLCEWQKTLSTCQLICHLSLNS